MTRDQALVNALCVQRNDAANSAAEMSADLQVVREELAAAKQRIAELEAQLESKD